ncbi:hypothetical protein FRC11_009684 [Ceratobasidium sp. 423]|nr:hypothetical protein FRC11_009684 [Ceratobasidium sp. 423]
MVQTPHQGASPSYVGSMAGSSVAPRSHSIGTAHSHSGSVTGANSLAFDDRSSCEGSMSRDTPAPTMIACRSHAQSNSNTKHQPQRALRQRDFTYEQVLFMNAMRKRWHWYLVAENLFPVNTSHALELCMQHAEQTLEVSRIACKVGHTALEFVRRKDSSIRSLLQTGLLSIIEDSYNVTTSTTGKLTELISQSNYIYTEYDIETKKISGRYRHPCLMRVLAAILFTKRIRGRPIGVCFMSSIMGGDEPEQPEGNGITPSMIALACTLVLYGLQSIKAGDSSERSGTRKGKPVNFTEKRYSTHYRNFVTKIRQYNRLEEVRKAYLEEMMKEYLQLRVDEMEDSDANVEADDEMHSDGD